MHRGVKGSGDTRVLAASKIGKPLLVARHLLRNVVHAILRAFRAVVRWGLGKLLAFMLRHRRWMPFFLAILAYFPHLNARLMRFAEVRSRLNGVLSAQIQWKIEPDPAVLVAWAELLRRRR